MDSKQFKIDDRYYFIQSVSFRGGGPNSDVGGIVFDVTDLPDVSRVREVGRVRPEGGKRNAEERRGLLPSAPHDPELPRSP